MKLSSTSLIALALAATAMTLSACTADPNALSEPTTIPATNALDESSLRDLLASGHGLYWDLPRMKGKRHESIGGRTMVNIEQAASMKALRERFAGVFTDAAIDTILASFGVREHGGALWMEDVPGGDVSDYDDAEIVSLKQDSAQVVAELDVPLGDSGQLDEQSVRAVRSGGLWKLATVPYGQSEPEPEPK